jgi:hypothetical protein
VSNVRTFNHALVDLLQENDGRWELDPNTSAIWCLSHIIHLAVLELLVVLKVVKKSSAQGNQSDDTALTEETAELLSGDGQVEGEEEKDNDAILRDQQGVMMTSLMCHLSQRCKICHMIHSLSLISIIALCSCKALISAAYGSVC